MPSKFFPRADRAAPHGLVAVGGELTVECLLDAYRHGIFPWPGQPEDPMLWWSPDPRCILPLDGVHVSKRLARRLRGGEFQFTCNQRFVDVLAGCSTGPGREGGTWLTPEMIRAYTELHRRGHAHSIEAWKGRSLVGGVYGVAVEGAFSAESMFHRARDASKAALVVLVEHLVTRGYQLLDIQQWTAHTGRMGAIEIPRSEYLRRLKVALTRPVTFGREIEAPILLQPRDEQRDE